MHRCLDFLTVISVKEKINTYLGICSYVEITQCSFQTQIYLKLNAILAVFLVNGLAWFNGLVLGFFVYVLFRVH